MDNFGDNLWIRCGYALCYYVCMRLDQFIAKYLGTTTDIDGVYGVQCVDLIKAYLREMFGIPVQPLGDAIEYWTATRPVLLSKFDRVHSGDALPGDIVILSGTSGNSAGHIGIAVDGGDSENVALLEQNGARLGGDVQPGDEVRIRQIPKTRIAGLLRPKQSSNTSVPKYYTIKRGDTFWALNRRFGYPQGTIDRMNPSVHPRRLRIGQKIKIG